MTKLSIKPPAAAAAAAAAAAGFLVTCAKQLLLLVGGAVVPSLLCATVYCFVPLNVMDVFVVTATPASLWLFWGEGMGCRGDGVCLWGRKQTMRH